MSLAPPLMPQRPCDLGDVFGLSFQVMRRSWRPLVAITVVGSFLSGLIVLGAVGIGAAVLVSQMSMASRYDPSQWMVVIPVVIGVWLLAVALAGAVSLGVTVHLSAVSSVSIDGHRPAWSAARPLLRGFWGRAVALLALYALAVAATIGVVLVPMLVSIAAAVNGDDPSIMAAGALGTFALAAVVAVLWLWVGLRLVYVLPVLAMEGVGGMTALRRSWDLTAGEFWRTFGYLLVMGLVVGAVSSVIGGVSQVLTIPLAAALEDNSASSDVLIPALVALLGMSLVISVAAELLLRPFQAAYVTVMYRDQLLRSAWRAAGIPATPQPTWQQGYVAPASPSPMTAHQGWQPPAATPGQGWQPPVPPPSEAWQDRSVPGPVASGPDGSGSWQAGGQQGFQQGDEQWMPPGSEQNPQDQR